MPAHEVALKGREEVAAGTMAFRFARPPGFAFQAGQAVSLALPEPDRVRRTFSLASAPFEDELVIATRMREASAFKRALKVLPVGAKVRLAGPLGAMTLHPDARRAAVFIAGGIGITPFRSMLRHASHERLAHRLFLLYANRSREEAAFLPELEALERSYGNFRLRAVIGRIDEETVGSVVAEVETPVCYVAGPPAMVEAMHGALARMGVAEHDVLSEEFYGY